MGSGWRTGRLKLIGGIGVVIVALLVMGGLPRYKDVKFIVGKYEVPAATPTPRPPLLPTPKPLVAIDPVFTSAPARGPSVGPPGPALAFNGPPTFKIPKDLLFFLVIGTDARPGEDMLRTRADSIHIVAVDPKSREGTILGVPRDSWVDIPGHGMRKINAATVYGGPKLLVEVLRKVTRLPITYYAITGFDGIVKIVDELKRVRVYVPYEMRDRYSGADFSKGWHNMDGPQVLSFSRARYGVPGGDFGRSLNHGRVMIDTLRKLRAETSNRKGIEKWMKILYKHAKLDLSLKDSMGFAMLARQMLPSELRNVVAPGDVRTIHGQSVVVLNDEAKALFKDVAADAVADGDLKRQKPKPQATPKPKPKPTPTPGVLEDLLPGL